MDDNRIGTRVRRFFVYEYMDDNRRRTRVRRFFVNEYMDDNRGGKTSELAGDGESVLRSKASFCHSSPQCTRTITACFVLLSCADAGNGEW